MVTQQKTNSISVLFYDDRSHGMDSRRYDSNSRLITNRSNGMNHEFRHCHTPNGGGDTSLNHLVSDASAVLVNTDSLALEEVALELAEAVKRDGLDPKSIMFLGRNYPTEALSIFPSGKLPTHVKTKSHGYLDGDSADFIVGRLGSIAARED